MNTRLALPLEANLSLMEVIPLKSTSPISSLRIAEPTSVWLVEDNDRYRATLMALLESTEGLAPQAFRSCEDFLEVLDEGHLAHVVLMDIELPGIDGIEGVRRLKSTTPSAHAIMLTVHEDSDRIFEAVCAGASGYLLKSASADDVLTAIDQVLRGGAPMDGQIAAKVLHMFQRIATPRGEYDLTEREKEILHLLVEGFTKKEIAAQLFVSYYTVDTHCRNIYAKLQVHSRSDAVARALRERLV
ncbi:MAG TPA: response regulator transcription factor [Rhodothermales bacterium]|nr:response regulator transcription factor [Rhodothermales bacterium]